MKVINEEVEYNYLGYLSFNILFTQDLSFRWKLICIIKQISIWGLLNVKHHVKRWLEYDWDPFLVINEDRHIKNNK